MMHNPEVIGREFAKQYYFILDRSPENLFRFYMESAQFDHDAIDSSADEPISAAGRDGIRDAVEARSSKHNFQFTVLQSVQSLATLADSVMVLVMGEISFDNAPMRPFSQTFVLVPETPFRYFVANDIFRYTDYAIDDDFDELADSDRLSGSSFMNDGVDELAKAADHESRDKQSLSLKGIIVKESQPLTRKSLLKSASAAPPPATEKLTWSEEMEACDEQAKHHDQMFQDQCILTIGNRINPNIRFDEAKESAGADTSSTIDQTEVTLNGDGSPSMAGGSGSAGQYSADDYAEYSKMEPFEGDSNYCGYADNQPELVALQMHHMTMGPILVYPMAPMQAYMHPSMISDPKQDEYLMQLVPAHPMLPERIEAARTTGGGEPMPAQNGGSKKSKAESAMQSTEDDVMNVQLLPKRRSSKSRRTLDKATGTDAPKDAANKATAGTQVEFDAVPVAAVKSAGIQCGSPLMSAKTTVAAAIAAEKPAVTAAPTPSPKAAESSKPVDQKPADRRSSSSTSSAPSKKPAAATKSPAATVQSFAPPAPAPSAATTAPTTTTYADLVKNPTSPKYTSDLPEIEAPAEQRRYSASFSRSEKPRLQRGMSFHGDRDKFQRSKLSLV